jgi:hypothetical protein
MTIRAVTLAIWTSMAATVASACRARTDSGGVLPDPSTPVLVDVESHFMGDVVVYLLAGSQRTRLGTVTALQSAAFTFPWRRLETSGSRRLLAYPIAGNRSFVSDPLYLQPLQSIKWTLESDLDRSTLVVY